jgi:hypothetical protein
MQEHYATSIDQSPANGRLVPRFSEQAACYPLMQVHVLQQAAPNNSAFGQVATWESLVHQPNPCIVCPGPSGMHRYSTIYHEVHET